MREIKFRNWADDYMDYCPEVEVFCAGAEEVFINGAFSDSKNGKWMQYTGLKDKNGTEIYVGDVVEDQSSEYSNFWRRDTVRFDEDYCGYVPFVNDGYGSREWVDFNAVNAEDVVIIGNIYENPELLENNNE